MSYSINVRWDHGQGPRNGDCTEWVFDWYGTEAQAEYAANDRLRRSNADRVEIWQGSPGTTPRGRIVRELHRAPPAGGGR